MGSRITVRLDDATSQLLAGRNQDTNSDVSTVVRQALLAFLQNGKAVKPPEGPAVTMLPSEEIAMHSVKYLSWQGDLRQEVRRLFLDLNGAVAACIRAHPRTAGLRVLHDGLLALGKDLTFGGNGRQS